MTDFRYGIRLEPLDARDVPSATPVAPTPATATAAHTITMTPGPSAPERFNPRAFAGWMAGEFAVRPTATDRGERIDFVGDGRLAHAGKVTITGHLDGVGLVAQGRAHGTLTVTNAHGSITFELTGPPQTGFSPLPNRFGYKIVSGTGAYAHAVGEGVLHVSLHFPPPAAVKVPVHGTINMWI